MRLLTGVILLMVVFPALAGEVRTLSGPVYKGSPITIGEKEVKLHVDGKETIVPIADVVSVDLQTSPKPLSTSFVQIGLIDGTLLRCQALGLKGKQAEVRLLGGLSLSFPASLIHHLLCDAQEEKNRLDFEQVLLEKPTQDVLRVLSRDGTAVNKFYGFVGDADAKGETLEFKTEGETIPVAMARIRGILFSRKIEEPVQPPLCRLLDTFGNTFVLEKLTPLENGYRGTTPAGLAIEISTPLVWRFDFSQGKVAYLSDLDPVRVEETPILADLWHYRRDKSLEGGAISLDRKTYSKGLALHSRTVLEYNVAGYNFFRCVLGIDDQVSGPAHAIVRIEGDGRELYQQAVTGKEKPRALDLKISGVNRLRLIVDYGEDLDLGDHVDFADARVTK